MNLIANESKLNLQQEKAIYELTLKKQRSKKSTISQKQVAAMQQLANELITQRKDFQHLIDHNQNQIDQHHHHHPDHHHHPSEQHHDNYEHHHAVTNGFTITADAKNNNHQEPTNPSETSNQSSPIVPTANNRRHLSNQLHRCTKSTTSSSFISNTSTASSSSIMSDETNIKLSQLRLEQLNNELERRLHQYEYLVAQEKAILSAYKINLFTNESVNNFHLFHLDQKSALYR